MTLRLLITSLICLFTFQTNGQTTHTINAGSYYYNPSSLTISVGDVVQWINDGGFHDVNANINSQTQMSFNNPVSFQSNATNTVGAVIHTQVFTTPGTYNYDCSIGNHAANGMVGQIIVSPPPPPLVVSQGSVLNVSCFGSNDGSLSINASGGTPPYQYSIDGGLTFQTSNIFNGLSGGTYSIQVDDAQLGIASISITISEPAVLTLSATISDVLCCGSNDGEISLMASGGTSPYQYSIDGGLTYQSSNIFNGLSAGSYSGTIIDANGCTYTVMNYFVSEPPCLQVDSIVSTPVSCNGGDGTATVYVSNGLGLLSYNWLTTPNQVSQQADSLSAGTYIVNVTDANGCIVNGGVTLTSPINCALDLFISEYAEGSSFNKYLEIYNPTSVNVDLADYEIWKIQNGNPPWGNGGTLSLSGTIAPNDVYVIYHPSSDPAIITQGDVSWGGATGANWNGNDAVGLAKNGVLIDAVGNDGQAPSNGSGWDVAGITDGTKEHTLIRKCVIMQGDTNWTQSAGTNLTNSQWVVEPQNYWLDVGQHTLCPPIYGCTDSLAVNYDPNATADDGSCIYCVGIDTTTVVECDSYTWQLNGMTYNTSGLHWISYTSSAGCTDTIILDLTVNYSNSDTTTISTCSSFVWDGVTYNSTGIYTNVYTNLTGCDSTHTLDLTVNASLDTVFKKICDGDSVVVGSSIYYNAGNYYDTLTAINGCDSILYTKVSLFSTPTLSIQSQPSPPKICLGEKIILEATNGFTYYYWMDINGNVLAQTQNYEDFPTEDTWYMVYGKDTNNCTVSKEVWVEVDSCVSNINEILSNKILVYPNPSSGKFNIDLDGVDLIGSKLDIINSLGKVIYKDLLDENNFHIDLKANSKGVYFIRIENNDNILIKKLTIK